MTSVCERRTSCLLDAETEVEQAVGGVKFSAWSFHLGDEATEAVAQLSGGAAKNILLQLHGTSWESEGRTADHKITIQQHGNTV